MFFEKRRFLIEFNSEIKYFFELKSPRIPVFRGDLCSLIISYQVITGNYNLTFPLLIRSEIISYQVITGNYNLMGDTEKMVLIISYQVITGNYNFASTSVSAFSIISYQVITGNYNIDPSLSMLQ